MTGGVAYWHQEHFEQALGQQLNTAQAQLERTTVYGVRLENGHPIRH